MHKDKNIVENNKLFTEEIKKYPLIRHLSSYESAINIIEDTFIKSKKELNKDIKQ